MSKKVFLVVVALLATSMACSEKSPSPAAPSNAGASVDDAGALADGSTLKVPAPAQVAPANGAKLDQFETTLKVNPVAALFAPQVTQFAYKFQLLLNGQVVREFRTSSFTEWNVTDLDLNLTYGWRCRAEQGQNFGPWSATWTLHDAGHPGRLHRRRRGLRPAVDRQDRGRPQRRGRVHPEHRRQDGRPHAATSSTCWGRPSTMASSRCWSPMFRPTPRAARRRSWRCARGGATSRPTTGASRSRSAATRPGPSPGA